MVSSLQAGGDASGRFNLDSSNTNDCTRIFVPQKTNKINVSTNKTLEEFLDTKFIGSIGKATNKQLGPLTIAGGQERKNSTKGKDRIVHINVYDGVAESYKPVS